MPAGADWQRAVSTDVVVRHHRRRGPRPGSRGRSPQRWAAITGCPLDGPVLTWDNATVTFTEGAGGLVAVDCLGPAAHDHQIGGVTFRVRPA